MAAQNPDPLDQDQTIDDQTPSQGNLFHLPPPSAQSIANQKFRRILNIPDKIADLISLPEGNDYLPFRDKEFYSQFTNESFTSNVWPEQYYGNSPDDIIKVSVYGNEGGLLTQEFLTSSDPLFDITLANGQVLSTSYGTPLVLKFDHGKFLRNLGYRKGQFKIKLEFIRLMAGSPFPLLVNNDEKIYIGEFTQGGDGYIYANAEHSKSNTLENDKLYVKENKFIITEISSDRSEAIIAPNFINDEDYLEKFRMAAFSCLNVFPELGPDGEPIQAGFVNSDSPFITIASADELPQSYINGTIRINDAYLLDKRISPAVPGELDVAPEIEIDTIRPNLLSGINLDNRFGWAGHGAWPNPQAVIVAPGNSNTSLMRLENMDNGPNPVGVFTVKAIVDNELNLNEGYLSAQNRTAADLVNTNCAVVLRPHLRLPESIQISGQTFTFSMYVKSPPGFTHRLQVHSGPWISGAANTSTSPVTVATGNWQRISFTFQMDDPNITDRLSCRLMTMMTDVMNPSDPTFVGTEWLMAGAQLEIGSEASKFTREKAGGDLTYERALNGIIQYEKPEDQNDRILIANFPDGTQNFNEKMVGGTISITDAIAVNDFSNVNLTTEADAATIWAPELFPADGDYGMPGALADDLGWDSSLHNRAIRVHDDFGNRAWGDGYYSFPIDPHGSQHVGTAHVGYHPSWLVDGGPNNEPCMYFPDINYQEYINEPMKAATLDVIEDETQSKYLLAGEEDPRATSQFYLSETYKHRYMQIKTYNPGHYGGGIAPLASYGVKAGDTLKFKWKQKSRPIDFDEGGRKGADCRFYKYIKLTPPDPPSFEPVVELEHVQEEMARIYPGIKAASNQFTEMRMVMDDGTIISGSTVDALEDSNLRNAIQNGWVMFDPAGYSKPTVEPISASRFPVIKPPTPPDPPSRRPQPVLAADLPAGSKSGTIDGDPWRVSSAGQTWMSPANDSGESNTNTWELERIAYEELLIDGWNWIGDPESGFWRYIHPDDNFPEALGPIIRPIDLVINNDHPDIVSGQIQLNGLGTETFAFGWIWWNGDWHPQHVKSSLITTSFIRYDDDQQKLTSTIGNVFPAHETLPSGIEIKSDDGKYVWGQYGWELITEEPNEPQYMWTHSDQPSGVGSPYTSGYFECGEYNEWEEASFEIVVGEHWALDKNVQIAMVGNVGSFGELWVANFELEIVRTNDQRINYVKDAAYGPLALTIEEVIDPTRIKVSKTYSEALSEQGGVISNLAISEYSPFDSGFNVEYIMAEESESPVYARYESKILNVQNQDGLRRLVVDKSYNEYGASIDAILTGNDSIAQYIPDPSQQWQDYFIRHRIKDSDNLYTYLHFNDDMKSLIVNFKPVATTSYPGAIAYKFLEPLPDNIEKLDMCYIGYEVTPEVVETVELIPFNDELIPDTVLRVPFFQDKDSPIRTRETAYKSHTDIVGVGKDVREKLEDRLISGSLETANINIDFTEWKNFIHFGSAEERLKNFKTKVAQIEEYSNRSQSLVGQFPTAGYLGNDPATSVSSSVDQVQTWEVSRREKINGFDEFENFMYFESSSYVTSSNGEFYDNAAPKRVGDGTLTSPFILHSVTSSQFTNWYEATRATASLYDRKNSNRLINLLPEHITYDSDNVEFLRFMDMIGQHYDGIWSHIRALTDVHDRTEDITKGISQALVEPVAKSLGFNLKEGQDLVSLPQYHLGLSESGSNSGVWNVRFTKRSQKDLTREIWNRLLASSPYLLKSKGTKQSLKGVLAAYGIPTSILRVQEYGGPRITGEPDFEIKQRFTKAVDFQGSEYIESPWYHTGNTRVPDTIEFRFKATKEDDMFLAAKHKTSGGDLEASIFLKNVSGSDGKGQITFMVSDYGAGANQQSMSLAPQPVYNGEYWSVMLRRRASTSHLTSSYSDMIVSADNTTTQSFDLFAGYFDSGIDEIIVKQSGSLTVTSSLSENYYATGSGVNNRWYIGGRSANTNSTGINMLSGSVMEWRYWNTPLTASAFWNHVAAPKSINGNHISSSYYDMDLRFSMDDNANLSDLPNTIIDYSLTGGQLYATASGFPDRVNFSNVSDRQKAFVPKIGLNKMSNKVRIENSILKTPDGALANLSPTERVEISSYDTAGLDSNKLGVFFAPSDVINEDIMLSLADMDFGSYLGDPRDEEEDRYTFGRFDRIADTYWQKWTTKQGFWDYIKLIKYYDLSLFDILRSLSPARAKKNMGLLFEPTLLERTKVVVGKKPTFEDVYAKAEIEETDQHTVTSSREYSRATVNVYQYEYTASNKTVPVAHFPADTISSVVTSSQLDRSAHIPEFSYFMSSSNALFRTATVTTSSCLEPKPGQRLDYFEKTGSRHLNFSNILKSDRIDYATVSSSIPVISSIKKFGVDYLLDTNDRDYTDAKVTYGGSQASFFSGLEPSYTASKKSEHNMEYEFYYTASNGRTASRNKLYKQPYSSSLIASEFESLFTTHAGLTNLAYNGCKEDGTTAPRGPGAQNKPQVAVEISEVNPYSVTTSGGGDTYLDTEITDE